VLREKIVEPAIEVFDVDTDVLHLFLMGSIPKALAPEYLQQLQQSQQQIIEPDVDALDSIFGSEVSTEGQPEDQQQSNDDVNQSDASQMDPQNSGTPSQQLNSESESTEGSPSGAPKKKVRYSNISKHNEARARSKSAE